MNTRTIIPAVAAFAAIVTVPAGNAAATNYCPTNTRAQPVIDFVEPLTSVPVPNLAGLSSASFKVQGGPSATSGHIVVSVTPGTTVQLELPAVHVHWCIDRTPPTTQVTTTTTTTTVPASSSTTSSTTSPPTTTPETTEPETTEPPATTVPATIPPTVPPTEPTTPETLVPETTTPEQPPRPTVPPRTTPPPPVCVPPFFDAGIGFCITTTNPDQPTTTVDHPTTTVKTPPAQSTTPTSEPKGDLPSTGGGLWAALVGLIVVGVGGGCVMFARRS